MFELEQAPPAPVLVVDDEEVIRGALGRVVTHAGGAADYAETSSQAKELIDANDYVCALLDKNLPDGSGIEILAYFKERRPRTEVLIITGYANMDSAIEALRLGAFDSIVKPFDVPNVVHRIKIAIERRRMRDEVDRLLIELRKANAKLTESRQEVQRAYLETVLRLSLAAEYRDDAAAAHVRRISRYAGILARAINATQDWVERIVYAAPLHDVGKIGVSDAILRKAGPLSPSERAAVNEHVTIGARILEGTTSDVLALAREIVLTHHERWDGKGYPNRLARDAIPLGGRIVAVCDAWDAVSTDRVYRKARSFEAAVEELRSAAGTQLAESLVTAFLDHLKQVRAIYDEDAKGG